MPKRSPYACSELHRKLYQGQTVFLKDGRELCPGCLNKFQRAHVKSWKKYLLSRGTLQLDPDRERRLAELMR
jgi:hypothetical protein